MNGKAPAHGKAPKHPQAAPAAVFGAVLVGLMLLALGAAAIQWMVVRQDWASGPAVLDRLVDAIDGSRVADWGLLAGIPMALIGLWLLFVALKPRRRTHERISDDLDAWLTPGALCALAETAAEDVPGVLQATGSLRRKTALTVRVATEPDVQPESVIEQVRAEVSSRVAELTTRTVDVRPTKASR
ncbi:DUF6286 domain-containing protein [Demetria terragena]|uniref:DUF6286 domain-containing protein n=1 Tax=Demetria terragena TaxID=63959 RepID=UPI0003822BF3|nr:DUF6286 domain-containing protein [Demetria terragena]